MAARPGGDGEGPGAPRRASLKRRSGSDPRARRELAENPNVHQILSVGRKLITDPAGRFAIYLTNGTGPQSATAQRVRLAAGEVESAVEEIRALLRERGRGDAEWALVVARARAAQASGTPVVVTHAGQMSRPILERLGFTPVARIDRLLDVLSALER